MRRCLIYLGAIALAQGCDTAKPRSMPDSQEGQFLHDRLGINTWFDEDEALARSRLVYDHGVEEGHLIAVISTAWSHGGMAIRIVSPIHDRDLYQPELHVAALTTSGVRLHLFIDGSEVGRTGYFLREWHRFPLAPSLFERAQVSGLTVTITCEAAGDWTFPMSAAYFRGFSRRLADAVRRERLQVSQEHQPVRETRPVPAAG